MHIYAKIGLSFIVVSALALSGCDGISDSSDGSSSDASASIESKNIVPYTVTVTNSYNGKTYISKAGATGKIKVEKSSYQGDEYIDFGLQDGVASVTFVDGTSTEYIDAVMSDGEKVTGRIDIDYKKGTEHIVGDSSVHGHVDCTNTYQSPLPIVWSSNEYYFELPNLVKNTMVSSTCPDWINDDSNDEAPQSMKMLTNYILTDSDGDTTKYSNYMEIK